MSELQDLASLIRSNTPLIVVETQDEARVVDLFRHVLANVWRALFRWSITEGLRRVDMDREDPPETPPDITTTLMAIKAHDQRGIYLLLDAVPYLGYASTQRMLREILDRRGSLDHTLVLVGVRIELPPELEAMAVRFSLRLPDENALLKMVRDEAALYQKENGGRRVEVDKDTLGSIVRNLRGLALGEALASAEQLAPCVLWIDELEKGLSSGSGEDGGVSRRVLGYFLTWMAERKSKVFLVATANAVMDLPPELLRKGRFDEIFFVDLPTAAARGEIFRLHLDKRKVDWSGFSLDALADASAGFSGAEIEQAIVSALYAAHAERGVVDETRLLAELRGTRPLSVLMAEQVEGLREWARTRTVPAD